MPNARSVPNRNDATRIRPGVVRPKAVVAPNSSDRATEQICSIISSLRRSIASPTAPAGNANRNTGRLAAVWTSVTMTGVGRSSVISQAVPTLPSQMPIFDARLASHTALKVGIASGVHAEGLAKAPAGAPRPAPCRPSVIPLAPAGPTGDSRSAAAYSVLIPTTPAQEFFPGMRGFMLDPAI